MRASEILGLDIPVKEIVIGEFVNCVKEEARDTSIDLGVAKVLKDWLFPDIYMEAFGSFDEVRTPYRFVRTNAKSVPSTRYHRPGAAGTAIATVLEAHLLGENGPVDTLEDVRKIGVVSFMVPIVLGKPEDTGIGTSYNEGVLESVRFEDILDGRTPDLDDIRLYVSDMNLEIAVGSSVFMNCDTRHHYDVQIRYADALFSDLRSCKHIFFNSVEQKELPEAMHQPGIEKTVPKSYYERTGIPIPQQTAGGTR